MEKCCFCEEIGLLKNPYSEIARENCLPKNRILGFCKYWYVVPTLGALVPGYLLIISKAHRLSVSECSQAEQEELQHLLTRIREILEQLYQKPCIAFEHGESAQSTKSAASVSHCHVHILPFSGNLCEKIGYRTSYINFGELTEIGQYTVSGEPYLFFQSNDRHNSLIFLEKYPRQLFRRILAYEIGKEDMWDWNYFPFYDNLRNTYQVLKNLDFDTLIQSK